MKTNYLINKVLIALAVAGIFMGLFSCTKTSSQSEEKTIKIVSYVDPSVVGTDDPEAELHQKNLDIFDAFSKKTGIKVEVITVNYAQVDTQLIITNKSGSPLGDVFLLSSQKLASLVNSGSLEPLDDYVSQSYTEKDLNDFNEVEKNTTVFNGKKYLFLAAMHSRFLFYNKEIVPNPPKTWDELVKIGQKVSDPQNKKYAFATTLTNFYGAIEMGYAPFVWGNGGVFGKPDGSLGINTKETLEAIDYLYDLAYKYKIMPASVFTDEPQLHQDLFMNGSIPMLVTGIWMLNPFSEQTEFGKRGNLGIATVPNKTGTGSPIFVNGWGWGIASNSKMKNEAWKFIEFMESPEIQKDSVLFDGGLPTRKSAMVNNENLQNPLFQDAIKLYNTYGKNMDPLVSYVEGLDLVAKTFEKYIYEKQAGNNPDGMKLFNEAVEQFDLKYVQKK